MIEIEIDIDRLAAVSGVIEAEDIGDKRILLPDMRGASLRQNGIAESVILENPLRRLRRDFFATAANCCGPGARR